jgi:hypothetical protein
VLRRSRAVVLAFTVLMALFAAGAALSYAWPDVGFRMLSAGALGLAAWLFRYDIARRTIRQAELTRFIAAALLSGYAWLFVGGALGLWSGFVPAGPRYDAVLHAVFVGFVFSMIFGHAPIILPAVLGVKVPWRPRFYVHLVALHLAMGLRVAGDLLELHEVRKLGAWGSAVAIVLFIAGTAWAVIAQQPAVRRSPALPV